MSQTLRVVLVVFSVMSAAVTLWKVRKSQMMISDAIYWVALSFGLVMLSIFPKMAIFGAYLLGVQSPANFVFLAILFLIIIKLFTLSVELSVWKNGLRVFAEEYAIRELEKHENEVVENGNLDSVSI